MSMPTERPDVNADQVMEDLHHCASLNASSAPTVQLIEPASRRNAKILVRELVVPMLIVKWSVTGRSVLVQADILETPTSNAI